MIKQSPEFLIEACRRPALALPSIDLGDCILCDATRRSLLAYSGSHVRVMEIGSWLGFSALLLAEANPAATILCVDPWLGSAEIMEMGNLRPLVSASYVRFLANTQHLADRIWPLRMTGIDGAVLAWECDFVPSLIFIDGSHQYESVWGDIHACRRLFPSATLVLDDVAQPDVRRAVDELLPGAAVAGNAGVFIP